jgi:phage shock protein E
MSSTTPRWIPITVIATAVALGLAFYLSAGRDGPPAPPEAVWIDVRSAEEYARGHLRQAPRIGHDEIESGIAALALDTDTPIYLYCAAGGRAGMAKSRLEALGYTNVTNVGGLEDARQLLASSRDSK